MFCLFVWKSPPKYGFNLGMATGQVWDGHPYPIPVLKYLIISHPRPKPETGRGPHSHPRLEYLLKSHTRPAPPKFGFGFGFLIPYTFKISQKLFSEKGNHITQTMLYKNNQNTNFIHDILKKDNLKSIIMVVIMGPLSLPDPFWRIRTESGMPCYHSITQNHIFAEVISKLGKPINIYI